MKRAFPFILEGVGKMKRAFLFILVFLVLLISTRTIYAQRAVVLSNTLNVRSGPGKQFEVIDKLNRGQLGTIGVAR
jgi:uncharacterized protein YgiM (DUF1202 family)